MEAVCTSNAEIGEQVRRTVIHVTASARKKGMTDAMFAELQAVIGMANETNRLANGYQVEVDEQFKTSLYSQIK